MRNSMRTLIGLLALALVAGTASAATYGHSTGSVASDAGAAGYEAGAYPDDRYYDADASAATDAVGGALDADASHSSVDDAKDGTVWGWFSLRLSAVIAKITDLVTVDTPELPDTPVDLPDLGALDAGVDVYASSEGVDLDADAMGHTFDDSPAGELDGKTWEAMGQVPGAPDVPALPLP
jgi:hypothetical protein